jgi:hypothetical protein
MKNPLDGTAEQYGGEVAFCTMVDLGRVKRCISDRQAVAKILRAARQIARTPIILLDPDEDQTLIELIKAMRLAVSEYRRHMPQRLAGEQ